MGLFWYTVGTGVRGMLQLGALVLDIYVTSCNLQWSGMTVAILHNWMHAIIKTYQHMDYKQQVLRQIKHILLNEIGLTTMLIQENQLLCTLPGKASPILSKQQTPLAPIAFRRARCGVHEQQLDSNQWKHWETHGQPSTPQVATLRGSYSSESDMITSKAGSRSSKDYKADAKKHYLSAGY